MAREWTPERIGEWNKKVFNRVSPQDCIGILNHAKREMAELIQAHNEYVVDTDDEYSKKTLSLELADMIILMESYAYTMGIDIDESVDHKMFINENRKWKEPDEEGVIQHEPANTV